MCSQAGSNGYFPAFTSLFGPQKDPHAKAQTHVDRHSEADSRDIEARQKKVFKAAMEKAMIRIG